MKHKDTIYRIAWVFIIIFIAVMGYLAYFTMVESKQIAVHPHNKRLDHLENEVIRGAIYAADGTLLAKSENDERVYPYGKMYAHAVGYSQRGKYGAEALANVELLYPDYTISSLFNYAFNEERFLGHDVTLTLEHELQQQAMESLGSNKGAVVMLEPTTGKILAMYSNPAFDPNTIEEDWDVLTSDSSNSVLVNRATQGLYPPASVFKIVTTLAYLEEVGIENSEDFTYTCTGSITKANHDIRCYNSTVHGEVTLEEAFAKSCNAYFIELSEKVSPGKLQKTGESLFFNDSLPVAVQYSESQLRLDQADSEFDVIASYIGQGKTLATPIHLAMISAMIYNDGVLMAPYMIDYSTNQKGDVKYKNLPNYKGAYIDQAYCDKLQELMIGVVKEGTASRIDRSDIIMGGKTGTAQNETEYDHSWFVGFAEAKEGNQVPIAFAIIVEQGGKGSKALDVAEDLIDIYFQ